MSSKKKILEKPKATGGLLPYQKVIIAIFVILISIKYVPRLFKGKCKAQDGDVWERSVGNMLNVREGFEDHEYTQYSYDSIYKIDRDKNMVYYYYGSDGMKDSCDCKDFLFESSITHAHLRHRMPQKSSENK